MNVIFKELTEIPSKQFSSYTDLFSKEEELDGIVLPGSLKLNETSFFTDLERKKIPYVFYNGLSETNNYLAYIGCNYIDAGKLAAGLSALLGSEAAVSASIRKVSMESQAIQTVSKVSAKKPDPVIRI